MSGLSQGVQVLGLEGFDVEGVKVQGFGLGFRVYGLGLRV